MPVPNKAGPSPRPLKAVKQKENLLTYLQVRTVRQKFQRFHKLMTQSPATFFCILTGMAVY